MRDKLTEWERQKIEEFIAKNGVTVIESPEPRHSFTVRTNCDGVTRPQETTQFDW